MQLDRVVLLGRTFEEYLRYFGLQRDDLDSKRILDVAAGVSSFCAEGTALGLDVTAVDPIYALAGSELARRCAADLDHVYKIVEPLQTYRWTFYRDRDHMRQFRERAYTRFLKDLPGGLGRRYISGELPRIMINGKFDLTLVSYFLFVYQEQLSYEFHRESLVELMRVTRGEARIYPTVTFEGEKSSYLERLYADPAVQHLHFEEVRTDFEFLVNSNSYLRVTHRL